ncbi:MAG: queuosine precursor transporter [Rhodospirillaceae bacterium]|nr:queuosine precursor transporter [Rhodospirillaceae bacterium]
MKTPLPLSLLLPIVAMMAVIGVSNVAVQHAINDWLTWGAFTYPLAFLVTDLTNRAWGPGRARTVAYVGFPFGMGLSIILAVAADIPLWEGVRVALASGFAFICAQLFDIALFHRLRRGLWWRAPLVSSLSASALDTTIFFSAAFALTGLPWVTWALGDFAIKVGMAAVLLIPFRLLMSVVVPSLYADPKPQASP